MPPSHIKCISRPTRFSCFSYAQNKNKVISLVSNMHICVLLISVQLSTHICKESEYINVASSNFCVSVHILPNSFCHSLNVFTRYKHKRRLCQLFSTILHELTPTHKNIISQHSKWHYRSLHFQACKLGLYTTSSGTNLAHYRQTT